MPSRHESGTAAVHASAPGPSISGGTTVAQFMVTDAQRAVLSDLQYSLRKHGIDAEVADIGKGILEALAARPSLCRGLLAAYLLDL
jgi:hypothetical protein